MLMYSIKWRSAEPVNEPNPSWEYIPVHITGWASAPSEEGLRRNIDKLKEQYGNITLENMEVQTL